MALVFPGVAFFEDKDKMKTAAGWALAFVGLVLLSGT
jgi:hypothetical protein